MNRPVSYETILVPSDGSTTAAAALDHGVELARQYGATLHGVYVLDTAALAGDMEASLIYDALEAESREVLQEFEETARAAGVGAVETSVLRGSPHRGILDYAEDKGVDLVVMGTHGRRGLERYLLGSVTEKVVRLSEIPVLTVHAHPGEEDGGGRSEDAANDPPGESGAANDGGDE